MKRNVGAFDQVLRICLGFILITWLLVDQTAARWWGLLGVVPLLTGWSGSCPLYAMIGLSTCGDQSTTRAPSH